LEHLPHAERPFRYRDRGTMATVSRFYAVASVGRVRMSGIAAWLLWRAVQLSALTGFRSSVSVFTDRAGRSTDTSKRVEEGKQCDCRGTPRRLRSATCRAEAAS
jgi:NADH dehydrogenase FAD-containing subunit